MRVGGVSRAPLDPQRQAWERSGKIFTILRKTHGYPSTSRGFVATAATMAAKAIPRDQIVKLIVGAGQASPSPPVGPALGSKGVKSMDFCKVSYFDSGATPRPP